MKKYLLATTMIVSIATAARADVVVMSWGGDYGAGQIAAFNKPFTEQTGIKSSMVDSDNPTALIKSMVEAKNVTVDVVEVEYPDAIRGCDEGLLEPVDPAILPAGSDGTAANDDFMKGAVTECGVATVVYSWVFAYDNKKFTDGPKTVADFFDTKKFPGKRALRKQPKFALEMALIADGVSTADVYKVLNTKEGVDRAFAKLGTVKGDLIWYQANAEAARLLADGEVVMSSGSANRFFNAAVSEGKPFTTVWDGQIYDFAMFVIPKGAPHLDEAKKYLAFATDTKQLAAMATELPFGPARMSAVPLVHFFKDGKTDIRPHMPTNPDNLKNGLAVSSDFWADHEAELTERFNAWLATN
ncbi:extracellular solute-binding protein family 1 (plasmid) [Rhizobium leguminosarum bv. trifolii WSM2304]|uniref:Extracellular solute-binding protein family 1 n=1 Tax=Rhizobium leguminosarum bv. trifolii (strain WSM2304) TaxID=395492 RepID=A0ABF7QZC9_RHILW|nr:ABC transporter substrate-binding protein [Rhizobium leguminosarum]ACI59688.1 extracellular solute-binding protein family 1 [Rhizobium leguminosarum bv. trifolii WSM2304]